MHEAAAQVRMQMESLMKEKSKLREECARLSRENDSLHELLDFHHHMVRNWAFPLRAAPASAPALALFRTPLSIWLFLVVR